MLFAQEDPSLHPQTSCAHDGACATAPLTEALDTVCAAKPFRRRTGAESLAKEKLRLPKFWHSSSRRTTSPKSSQKQENVLLMWRTRSLQTWISCGLGICKYIGLKPFLNGLKGLQSRVLHGAFEGFRSAPHGQYSNR